MRSPIVLRCLLAGTLWQADSLAQQSRDLTEISLEELMNVEVVSASKKQQRLSKVPAAVYVITGEDIRRSGATSIPEALRLAPGVQVARIDANKWAISVRGFNGRWSNKLLVLMDGRSIYSPMFSGVYWELQDTLLQDIERIEVIRGPGGTVWGANAVNGVINVITRHARETHGGLVTGGAGNEERGFGAVRWGGGSGPLHYRIFSKYFNRSGLETASGEPTADGWNALRGGFRMDWEPSRHDALTLLGDLQQTRQGQTAAVFSLQPPYTRTLDERLHASGGSLLARWTRTPGGLSESALQVYFDRTRRTEIMGEYAEATLDASFEWRRQLGRRHDLQWGGGARRVSDATVGSSWARLDPPARVRSLFSAFVQDEVALWPEQLYLTSGIKWEHHHYTGSEIQPQARLLWIPADGHALWGGLSRAVRTPARYERDVHSNYVVVPTPTGLPAQITTHGSEDFRSTAVRVYELGYRLQATARLSAELTGFTNRYRGLSSLEMGDPVLVTSPPPPHLVVPAVFSNGIDGTSHGFEASATWSVSFRWKLSGAYSWLRVRLDPPVAGRRVDALGGERGNPEHQAHVRSYVNLPWRLELDAALCRVGTAVHDSGFAQRSVIPAYTRADVRLGWRLSARWELSLSGQNLLDPRHSEFHAFDSYVVPGAQVRRSLYGRLTWRF